MPIARDQQARYGDIIVSTENHYGIEVDADPQVRNIDGNPAVGVANNDRWRVLGVRERDGAIEAMRIGDRARAVLPGDYAQKHIQLGYVGTMHGAQGGKADVLLGIGDPDTMNKVMAYSGLTRGVEMNRLYMSVKIAGEDEHHRESSPVEHDRRIYDASETQAMFMSVLRRDDREQTALAQAEDEPVTISV